MRSATRLAEIDALLRPRIRINGLRLDVRMCGSDAREVRGYHRETDYLFAFDADQDDESLVAMFGAAQDQLEEDVKNGR